MKTTFVTIVLFISSYSLTFASSEKVNSKAFLGQSYKSAYRNENESFEHGWARLEKNYKKYLSNKRRVWDKNAQEMAVHLSQLDSSKVTRWDDEIKLKEVFKYIRDFRFIDDPDHPSDLRRITWLFPDDGCYARAALAMDLVRNSGLALPKKVYIFGNLRVKTPNMPAGKTGWIYHVAPIVSVNKVNYVLDPALEPRRPLTLSEWMYKMVKNEKDARIAICSENTYIPGQSCLNSTAEDGASAYADQTEYLPEEWNNLIKMNRDPAKELRDFPPWTENF